VQQLILRPKDLSGISSFPENGQSLQNSDTWQWKIEKRRESFMRIVLVKVKRREDLFTRFGLLPTKSRGLTRQVRRLLPRPTGFATARAARSRARGDAEGSTGARFSSNS
jgi:hypothetical protein